MYSNNDGFHECDFNDGPGTGGCTICGRPYGGWSSDNQTSYAGFHHECDFNDGPGTGGCTICGKPYYSHTTDTTDSTYYTSYSKKSVTVPKTTYNNDKYNDYNSNPYDMPDILNLDTKVNYKYVDYNHKYVYNLIVTNNGKVYSTYFDDETDAKNTMKKYIKDSNNNGYVTFADGKFIQPDGSSVYIGNNYARIDKNITVKINKGHFIYK